MQHHIKEICNYQSEKTLIILEVNVTSDCNILITKGARFSFVPKGVRFKNKIKIKKFIKKSQKARIFLCRVVFYFYEDILLWNGFVSSSNLANMDN